MFALRPEVYAAWQGLNGAIKEGMDLRHYEPATLAAALSNPSSSAPSPSDARSSGRRTARTGRRYPADRLGAGPLVPAARTRSGQNLPVSRP